MSTLKNPVGPEDRKVYVRRRWVAFGILVAIVAAIALLVVLVWVRPGSSGGPQEAAVISTTTDDSGLEDGSTASEDTEGIPNCSPGQLVVTPLTSQASYAAGENPELSLEVENTGTETCQADLGTAGMLFSVTSGSDEVWTSSDCQEDPEELPTILDPGEPLTTEPVTWDRTRSSPETCEISREPVAAGGASYHLRTSVGGVESAGTAQFLLY